MGNSPSILLETVKNRDVQQFNNIVPKISQIGLDINYVDEEGKVWLIREHFYSCNWTLLITWSKSKMKFFAR